MAHSDEVRPFRFTSKGIELLPAKGASLKGARRSKRAAKASHKAKSRRVK
jgi:hypothetical protein